MSIANKTSRTELGWYLDRIKSSPLLTAQEERDLARRIRKNSDPDARERMVSSNLRLVVKIAKDYSNPGMTLGDLVAEGNLGLMRAVEDFNPDAGVRFSTYAAWWIKQAIKRAMINAGQQVRIPDYLAKLIGKWRRASGELSSRFGRPPMVEEMAAELHISLKKAGMVAKGLKAVNIPTQAAAEDSQPLSETLVDTMTGAPEQALMDASNGPIVQSLLEKIEPRLRRILELRFGFDGHEGPQRTYKEIGKIIGLTRERVRQLEKEAMDELKVLAEAGA